MVRAVRQQQPDAVFHLGDCERDTQRLEKEFPDLPLYRVCGNCGYYRDREVIETGFAPIPGRWLTLGVAADWVRRSAPAAAAWRERFNPHDDGRASERVVRALVERGALG